MKDFSITPAQRNYLRMALTGSLYTGGMFSGHRNLVGQMEKRGWIRRCNGYNHLYEITDLGRTVARQLGIVAEKDGA